MLGLGLGVPMPVGVGATMDGPFSPLDLSPILWLDASDTSTITEVAGAVSQWDNKGSLGNFTQGTAAYQPTTGVTTLNGLNVLDFASDYLSSADAAAAYNALHDGTDCIVASVIKFGTTANPDTIYDWLGNSGSATATVGVALAYDDRSSVSRNNMGSTLVSRGVSGTYAVIQQANNTITANTFHVVTELLDTDNATAANRSRRFIDDGSASATNTQTHAPSTSDATYPLDIGRAGTNQNILVGSIAELVIVTGSQVTETNRQALRDYLNAKWAVY